MANVGEIILKDGIAYRVISVPEGDVSTYSILALHRKDVELKKTVETTQSQSFLIPSGSIITGVSESDLGTLIGTGSAVSKTIKDGYVKIIFKTNGGTEIDAQTIEVGDGVVAPDNPTKEGYTFNKWCSNSDGTGDTYNLSTANFDEDTYVYAVYTLNTYTVTFDSNDGSDVTAQTVNHNAVATSPVDPTLEDYIFGGWFTDDTTFLEEYDFATPVTADITLYAKWDSEV